MKHNHNTLKENTGDNLTFILGQVNISWNPEITQHKKFFKWMNWIPSELKLLLIPQYYEESEKGEIRDTKKIFTRHISDKRLYPE